MKNTKKLVGIILAVLMLMTILPVAAFAAEGTTVYFDVNSSWPEAGARFAVYYFNDEGNGWVDLVADGDLYKAEIPAGFGSMIICRMNPASSENDWGNKWNQTANLTVPTGEQNCFAIPYGNWDNADDTNWYVKGQQPNNDTQEGPVVYYVAGEEALCGVNWKENAAENKMAKNADGVWELVFQNVAAGTYQFKVTNGTWAQSWGGDGPGGNYQFEVAAKSNVKILFDGEAIQVIQEEIEEEKPVKPAEKQILISCGGFYPTAVNEPYNNKDQLVLTENKAEALVLTMVDVDGVITFKTADGKFLYADGTNVRLVEEEGEFTKFVFEDTEGGKFIRCLTANFNGKPQYLEVYKGKLTCYGMGKDTSIYTFALEAVEVENPGNPENPDNGDGVMLVAMVGFVALAGVAMMLNLRKKEIF